MANSTSHVLPYPIKQARFTLPLSFRVAAGTPTDPTTPDTEFSTDGGATFTDCAEEITTGGGDGMGYLTITGAETNANVTLISAKSANCLATNVTLYPRVLAQVGTGTLSAGSAGGGTLGTVLAYDVTGCFIQTTGGTGGGGTGGANNQARKIVTYVTSTGVFTVTPNWETTPDATTTYSVLLPEGVTLGMLRTLNPATAGRTLVVDASGLGDANTVKLGPTGTGTAQTARDIGLAVPAVAAGAANGLLISGTNAGTTTFGAMTITGTFTISDGISVTRSSSNADGVSFAGNGSGNGFTITGGLTGAGIKAVGGGTSGDAILTATTSGHGATFAGTGTTKHGINATGGATTSHGISATGGGVGHGILATSGGGATGDGIRGTAASTNGNGFNLIGNGTGAGILATSGGGATGNGMTLLAASTNGNGFSSTGTGTGAGLLGTSGGGATGDGMKLIAASTNGHGFNLAGVGTGSGILATGGTTGRGLYALGGATSGAGIRAEAQGGTSHGFHGLGFGAGDGMLFAGGTTGVGAVFAGGATSGAAVSLTTTSGDGLSISPTAGHGINVLANGSGKHGFLITGGTAGVSDGMKIVAGTGGVSLNATLSAVTSATLANGNHGGNVATLTLSALTVQRTGGNPAVSIVSDGVAIQVSATGGHAMAISSTTDDGVNISAPAGAAIRLASVAAPDIVGTLRTLTTYTGDTPQTGNCFTVVQDIQTDVDELQTTAGTLATAAALSTAQTAITDIQGDVDAIETTVNSLSTGAGSGAYTITVHVTDGSASLQSVLVRMTNGGNTYTATTNSSGNAVLYLDAATYAIALTRAGYQIAAQSNVVITATATLATYAMTAISISPPANPNMCTGYFTALNAAGAATAGIVHHFVEVVTPGTVGYSIPRDVQTATSDVNGLVQMVMNQSSQYDVCRLGSDGISGPPTRVTILTSGTQSLAEIVGKLGVL